MKKVKKVKIPSLKQCEKLIAAYEMPVQIRKHSEAVRRIANELAEKISKNKTKIDLDLVDRASLMHDFLKMHCIKNKCRHAEEAGNVLSQKGFPEFGKIVKLHGLDEVNSFDAKTSIEAKVVWYADKRVSHDSVVTMEERYEYFRSKYGSVSEKRMREINSTWKNALKIE